MSRLLRCPQGHQWEELRGHSSAPTLADTTCPRCGQPGQEVPASDLTDYPAASATPAGGATIAYAPNPPTPPDHGITLPSLAGKIPPPKPNPLSLPSVADRTEQGDSAHAIRSADSPPTEGAGTASGSYRSVREASMPRVAGFEILEEIGRGGMGVVYRARHVRLNRIVALKMILAGGHASAAELQRFRVEAEAIAQLQHPNVVQIYSVGEQGGRPFFALEYVDGGSLGQKVAGRKLKAHKAAALVEQLARGIHAAHEEGIVHRDLKPANVLLAADGTPKIVDFGLAKKLDAGHGKTQTGAVLGTPSYMAPEQAGGKKEIGPAVDIYALGAVLYELLTGQPPFRGANSLETVLQVMAKEVTPPRQLQATVPRDLETICLKCLRKEPRERYATAEALADDLRRFLDGEPIRARPLGPLGRAFRWARRRPATVAAIVGMVAALAVVGWLFRADLSRLATNRGRIALGPGLNAGEVVVRQDGRQVAVLRPGTSAAVELDAGEYDVEWVDGAEGQDITAARISVTRNSYEILGTGPETVGELRRLDGHQGPVQALALSPDGRQALSGSGAPDGDRTLRLWNVAAGKEVARLGKPDTEVLAVAFSPDGTLALSGGADGIVRLWGVSARAEVRQFTGHKGAVRAVAFSADGRLAASGGADKVVRLWDVETGKARQELADHTGTVYGVTFSPDGKLVASVGADGTLLLWDVADAGKARVRGRHAGAALCVAFSPDGSQVATGGQDNLVQIWNVRTGLPARKLIGHAGAVTALAFSPEGRQLLSGSADRTVRVWDVLTREERRRLPGHADGVLAVAVAPGGRHALSAGGANFVDGNWIKGRDFGLRWWAVPRPRAPRGPAATDKPGEMLVLRGHTGEVCPVAFTPDGTEVLTGGWDGKLFRFNADTGQVKGMASPGGKFLALAVSPDGKYALSGSSDSSLRQWDVATGKELRRFQGHVGQVGGLAYSPDGKYALSAGTTDRLVYLWDARTGTVLRRFTGHTHNVQSVSWSHDGKFALSSSDDHTLRLWNVETGREVRCIRGHTGPVWKGALSPDSTQVLSASHDGTVRLWDTATGEAVLCLRGHQGIVYAAAFTPDGRRAVSVGTDRTVRVWDLLGGEEEARFVGHTDVAKELAVSLDGTRAVTGSADRTARIWRLPSGPPPSAAAGGRGLVVLNSDTPAVTLLLKRTGGGVRPLTPAGGRPQRLLAGQYTVQMAPGNVRALRIAPVEFNLQAGQTLRIEVTRGPDFVGEVGRLESGVKRLLGLALSARGDRLLAAGTDGKYRILDLPAGKETREIAGIPAPAMTLAPDGRRALIMSPVGARVMDLNDGKEVCRLGADARFFLVGAFLPGGKQLLTGEENGTVRLWDAATGKEVRRMDTYGARVASLVASADGKRALAGGTDGTVALLDLASGAVVQTFRGHRIPVFGVALSPDGRLALSASADGTARLWDIQNGREVRRLVDNRGPLYGAAFSPDSRRAFTWGTRSHFAAWEVSSGRRLYTSPNVANAALRTVAVAPDAALAAWAEMDGTIHLVQLPGPAFDPGPLAGNIGELILDLEGLAGTVLIKQNGQEVQRPARPLGIGFNINLPLPAGTYDLEWTGRPLGTALTAPRVTLQPGAQQIVGVRRGPTFVGEIHRVSLGTGPGRAGLLLPDGRHALYSQQDGDLMLWDVEAGRVVRLLKGHIGNVLALTATADGKRVGTAGLDGTLRVWDVAAGKELARIETPKQLRVTPGAFALSPDGSQALCGLTGRLCLLETAGGDVVREFAVAPDQPIANVVLSPDGRRALTGDQFGAVTVWDVATGKGKVLTSGEGMRNQLMVFSPDGRRAIVGGLDQVARLWDLDRREELHRFRFGGVGVYSAAFSPDGARVALSCSDSSLRLWDVALREEVYRGSVGSGGTSMTFTPDGRRLLLGAYSGLSVRQLPGPGYPRGQLIVRSDPIDATVLIKSATLKPLTAYLGGGGDRVFNLQEGPRQLELQAAGPSPVALSADRIEIRANKIHTVHVRRVLAPLAPPDPARLAAAEKELKVLQTKKADTDPERERLRGDLHTFLNTFRGLPPTLEAARAMQELPSPLDRLARAKIPAALLTTLGGGDARRAPPELAAVLGDMRQPHPEVRTIAFAPDGKWLATGGSDGTVSLWDLAAEGKEPRSWAVHPGGVWAVAFSPDGKLLATAGEDRLAVLWDAATGKKVRELKGHGLAVRCVAFSPDGQTVATGADRVRLWRVEGNAAPQLFPLLPGAVQDLAFSPDGKLLAAGGTDNRIHLHDVADGKQLRGLAGYRGTRDGLAFSPDGRVLASLSWGGVVLWETATGTQVRRLNFRRGNTPRAVAWWSGGPPVAAVGTDGVVILWDPETGDETDSVRLPGASGPAGPLAWSPEGRHLAIGHGRFVSILRLAGPTNVPKRQER